MAESTAVARPMIPPHIAAKIDERRAINEVARQIGNLSWGKGLTADGLRAVAEYARRYNIDAAAEIDILGGKIYRNAAYYIRRGAELLRAGIVTDISVEHVNADHRLTSMAERNVEGAQAELDRRELARIKHNIPDAAKGAVVVRIATAEGAVVEGANYAGVGRDPVGSENPGKTAETRAYRRAWRLLVDTIPQLKDEEGAADEAGVSVSAVVVDERAKAQELAKGQPGHKQLATGGYYDEPEQAAVEEPEVQPLTREDVETIFDAEEVDGDAVVVALDVALGKVVNGKALGDVRNSGLKAVKKWADGKAQEEGDDSLRLATISAACTTILDARARGEIEEPEKKEAA